MTSAEFAHNRDNFCFRHPDRQSFVLCQRCLRTICAECQTQAPVGVICPECLTAQRKAESPAQRRARRQSASMASMFSGRPPTVTAVIVAVTAFVGLLQMIPGFGTQVTQTLLFFAPSLYPQFNGGVSEPWRLLTPLIVHGGFFHLALNMLALYVIGRSLEPMLGKWRFLALYLISGLGGSVAVALIEPLQPVVGASGAIFGLFGAILVIGRKAGANMTGIIVILGINLVIGFLPGFNIAWQAHIGGAIAGALVGLILVRTTRPSQVRTQWLLLGGLTAVLLLLVAIVVPALISARFLG